MVKEQAETDEENISLWQTPKFFDQSEFLGDTPKSEEDIRKQIYEESYVKGYQAGMKAGREKISTQLELLNELISMLSSPFHDMNNQIVEELAALAGKIARGLVKRELRTEPESIMAIIRDSIRALSEDPKSVTVYLHPDDAEILNDMNKRMSEKQFWNVIDDPLLSRGDCRISKDDSLIDENIQDRINLIISQVLGDERNENKTNT